MVAHYHMKVGNKTPLLKLDHWQGRVLETPLQSKHCWVQCCFVVELGKSSSFEQVPVDGHVDEDVRERVVYQLQNH
jgi:hypothetical protein